ncbi:MAG: glycerate kinase [Limisphaera sp.]|nr:glycerate kinase [Limisphaera sp.]
MRCHVLICPDKFKGTLTALQAARAIARGWHRVRPRDTLDLLPISDGGDGFGEVCGHLLGAQTRHASTIDAAGRPCRVRWWWVPSRNLALVESARAIGLARLPPGRFHPFELDTSGLGALLRRVARSGASRVLLGLGGSATNDGGFGLGRALGWRFYDRRGRELLRWTELSRLARGEPPPCPALFRSLTAAVDVTNPLLGPRGATRIYGPQKGLRPEDFPLAERCLRRLATVMEEFWRRPLANQPGAGAAGGLGFGVLAFARGRLVPGFAWVARHARLWQRLRAADLVITGEGGLDRSSLMGKGVGQIALACRRRRVPCLALVGRLTPWPDLSEWFRRTYAFTSAFDEVRAQTRAAEALAELAERAARDWSVDLVSNPPAETRKRADS